MFAILVYTLVCLSPQMNRPIQVKPADSEGRGGEFHLFPRGYIHNRHTHLHCSGCTNTINYSLSLSFNWDDSQQVKGVHLYQTEVESSHWGAELVVGFGFICQKVLLTPSHDTSYFSQYCPLVTEKW